MDKPNFENVRCFVSAVMQGANQAEQQAVHTMAETSASQGGIAALGNKLEKTPSVAPHDVVDSHAGNLAGGGNVAGPQGGSIPDAEIVKLLRASGTAVWKLGQRMLDEETKEPKTDEFRRLWRHVESIKDALAEIGVEVIDWTGRRYDEGMSLKVVAEEERVGAKEVEIVETLLPTIRFRKRVQLQQGEVVVSRPSREEKTIP